MQDDTIVWYGFDWSSEVAFYSERKSLTVPTWYDFQDTIDNTSNYLERAPSAFVVCDNPHKKDILAAIRAKHPEFPEQEVAACRVFLTDPGRPPM
jgi:hypothetical protein